MSKFTHKEDQCFIETHFTFMPIIQQCNGTPVTYFEDFTDNHNKTIIRVEDIHLAYVVAPLENAQQQPMPVLVTVIIDTRDGKTIERTIPVNPDPSISAERTFQVEDVCRISVRCECGGVGTTFVEFDLNIDKTFCICCPEDNNDNQNCDRCGSQNECRCSHNSYYHNYYSDF